jgi:hypothetical protein
MSTSGSASVLISGEQLLANPHHPEQPGSLAGGALHDRATPTFLNCRFVGCLDSRHALAAAGNS